MTSTIEAYGRTADGEAVQRIHLEGEIAVQILTYGAIIERIDVPDQAGQCANVVLGLNSLEQYATSKGHLGAIAARYGGRIGGARFVLDGTEYRLPQNDGANCLHGGPRALDKRVWTVDAAEPACVVLSYVSPDGDEGFPGTLLTRLTYRVAGRTLQLRYEATSDRPTVLNPTNHSYFNLAGEGSGSVLDHVLQIEADRYLDVNPDGVPTGTILDVAETPFDFRAPHRVGERIRVPHPQILLALGYDQCWAVRGEGMRRAATLKDPASGRRLDVWSDEPGVQVYTANKLTGALVGPSHRTYRAGDGITFETQHYPDSPNHPGFPSTVLRPGEVFRSATDFVFSADPGDPSLGAGGRLR